jgi:hypothetical protein
MVAKINVGSSLYGALSYNGEKVNAGEGKLLATHKVFDQGDGKLDIARCMEDFRRYIPEQVRCEKPVAHISLNPHPDDRLNDAELMNMAQEYLEGIGYGNQPYVVFKHSDISREHLHIVTLNVDERGRRLSDRYIHRRSKRATDALEKQYNLHPSGSRRQRLEQGVLNKVDASQGNVRRQVGNVLRYISGNYRFQTIGEYRALLSLYDITVEEVRGEKDGREYRGFVYSATDDNGEKIGNPIKASRFGKYAGCEAFDKRCSTSKTDIQNKDLGRYTKGKVFAAMHRARSRKELVSILKTKGIDVVLRETDTGRIYGATFIDHNTGCVLNGSRMGKELSANALEQWISTRKAQAADNVQAEPQGYVPRQQVPHEQQSEGDTVLGGMLDLSMLPDGTDPEEEAFRHRMQRKKKKRKGRGI